MLLSKYRTVLKNIRRKETTILASCALIAFSLSLAGANGYYYYDADPGSGVILLPLRTDPAEIPGWFHTAGTIYVTDGGASVPSGNNIYIKIAGSDFPAFVFGGGSATEAVQATA